MFGGKEIETATTIYKLLHKFNNQIYYILTDTNMPFIDYYKHIKNKDFANNYKEDDFKLQNDIIILSQFKNFDYIKKIHKDINIKNIVYMPFALWKIELPQEKINKSIMLFKITDLIYGGSFRAGKRLQKMIEYFFNKDINVELFGSLSLDQFKDRKFNKVPMFTGKVDAENVINKNSEGLATLIIGDENYNNNTITLRVYESLLSDAIVFIDNDFDIKHEILKNDWFYVNSGKELEDKIKILKDDYNLLNKYKTEQNNLLNEMKLEQKLSNQIKLLFKEEL